MVKYFDKHVSGQMLNELQEVMKSIFNLFSSKFYL